MCRGTGKARGRPKGKKAPSKAKPSTAKSSAKLSGRGRGRGAGRGRGRGRGQSRPASPTHDDVSASSSDGENEEHQQNLGNVHASGSSRQLRQRSGSVRYDEGPAQQEGTGVLADDDSVEWEAAAPDVSQ